MNRIVSTTVAAALAVFAVSAIGAPLANAEETTGEKIQTKAGEVKKDMRKNLRKMKRKSRDAAGKDSAAKNAEDALNNAGDDVEHEAHKAKRKID